MLAAHYFLFYRIFTSCDKMYGYLCCYLFHGMVIIADKGFWSLWDSTAVAMVMLLKGTCYVQLLLPQYKIIF